MPGFLIVAVLAAVSIATMLPAHAGVLAEKPDTTARQSALANLQAVTIWVDASWGFRTQGAANALNRAHEAFANHGYRVLSVPPHIENGDLQGFCLTHHKPRTCNQAARDAKSVRCAAA